MPFPMGLTDVPGQLEPSPKPRGARWHNDAVGGRPVTDREPLRWLRKRAGMNPCPQTHAMCGCSMYGCRRENEGSETAAFGGPLGFEILACQRFAICYGAQGVAGCNCSQRHASRVDCSRCDTGAASEYWWGDGVSKGNYCSYSGFSGYDTLLFAHARATTRTSNAQVTEGQRQCIRVCKINNLARKYI
jgi:hypothetical protein